MGSGIGVSVRFRSVASQFFGMFPANCLIFLVGVAGFEPATPSSRKRGTRQKPMKSGKAESP